MRAKYLCCLSASTAKINGDWKSLGIPPPTYHSLHYPVNQACATMEYVCTGMDKRTLPGRGPAPTDNSPGTGKRDRAAVPGMPPSLSTPLFIPGLIVTPAEKRATTTTVQYNCTQTPRGPGRHLQPALAPETQYWVDTAFYSPCVIASSFCMCVH